MRRRTIYTQSAGRRTDAATVQIRLARPTSENEITRHPRCSVEFPRTSYLVVSTEQVKLTYVGFQAHVKIASCIVL